MTKNSKDGSSNWVDPDDAPELTAEWFDRAEVREGERIIRRGRPPLAHPKQLVTIRFPQVTLAKLRARGPGWQGFVIEAVNKQLAADGKVKRPRAVPRRSRVA